ncbi:MAG: aldo/keto reductase [Gemmatimonadota bacterium]|jgi:aryl-alcohol dehydrogenase-like predicted oxidoreductase
MTMMNRRLGRTGWRISEIGYGAWQIGGTMWGMVDDDHARAAVEAALETGIDFFDTALAYGHGRSERVIGEVVAAVGERDRVRIASKVPPMNWQWPARADAPLREVFPADWIRECAHRSLENLGGDPIDLLQLHVWADAWTDDDEWYDALCALREEHVIRAFGVSVNDHEPESAIRVTRSGRVDTVQVIYNVFDQSPEDALFPAAQEAEVGVIVRVPLDEGSLGGTLTADAVFGNGDMRRNYFRGDRLAETVKRVERLRPLLEADGQSMAQGALRFCLSHPAVCTVIPGSTDPAHIRDNASVSAAGPLAASVRLRLKSHAWPRNFYGAGD